MKKFLSMMLIAVFLTTTAVYAATPKIGDVINHVLATDIVAYIDGQPINSYNIDGNTAVVVEQLDKYGFDISWDGALRQLNVTRSVGKNVSGGNYTSSGSAVKVGTAIMDVYYTDISTYLNGYLCDSYNVGGQTIVYLDDLNTIYGDGYNWNGANKTISLALDDEVHYTELPHRAAVVQPLIPTSKVAETEVSKSSEEDNIRRLYNNTDYGGYEFTLLSYKPGGHFYNKISGATNEIYYEEQTGAIFDDAVYRRNLLTEELLNIKINPMFVDDYHNTLRKIVMAGEPVDAALGSLSYNMELASSGYLANLLNIPSLDLSQPWFDQQIIKDYNYKGKIYTICGAGNIFDDYAVPVVFYGIDIMKKYGLTDPADIVSDGKWTIDMMMTMGEKVTSDVDGDGKMNDNDSYGYLDNNGEIVHLLEGAGYTMADNDNNCVPHINCFKPGYVEAAEFIYNRVTKSQASWHCSNETAMKLLKENRALFYYDVLGRINELRNMGSSFSLLPCPKLNEEQDKYVSVVNSIWSTSYSVPCSTPNDEMTGTVLSVLNAFSVNTINDVIYDIILGTKSAREEKPKEMLSVILNNKKYDWGNGFSWSSSISDILNDQVSAESFMIASNIEKSRKLIQKSFDKLLLRFDELYV